MIWAVVMIYVLAGATIGRMCYEFDVYADDPRPVETRMCWITGAVWFVVPLWALWIHIKSPPRPT